MSKYTTQVRFICESYASETGDIEGLSYNEIINKSWKRVFNFDFPIFDEKYREPLCKKILKHYYTQEIGSETVELWKLRLDTTLNELMPYYNQLYKSTLLEFDPLTDVDITKTSKVIETGNTKGNSNSQNTYSQDSTTDQSSNGTSENLTHNTDKNINMFSDTPNGGLTNVENGTYLSSATVDTGEATSDSGSSSSATGKSKTVGKNSGTSKGDYFSEKLNNVINTENTLGKTSGRSYAKMLMEFRKTFLNIDRELIDDLSDLFMLVW